MAFLFLSHLTRLLAMTALTRFSFLTISVIVLFLFVFSASAQNRQIASPSSAALAADLHSGDTDRIAEAISYLPWDWTKEKSERMSEFRQSVDPLVANGLIVALDSQVDKFISLEEGHEERHYMIDLLDSLIPFVASLENEKAIPALLKSTEFGNTAAHGLAAFGPRIFSVIIDYIESPERTVNEIDNGFLVLARTVERWRPLDPSIHAMLRELSIPYIQGYIPEHLKDDPFSDMLQRSGMFFASTLGDADLKSMVSRLASKYPWSVEMYLERWYEGPSGAVQQEPSE